MQDTLSIIGLVVASVQLLIATVAAIYVSLQLRTMKEQTKSLAIQAKNMADQTGLLKNEQAAMVTLERQKKSFEFISRFNGEEMIKLRHEAVEALNKQGKPRDDETRNLFQIGLWTVQINKQGKLRDDETHALIAYLNFFEEMAMAILSQFANEAVCKQYFHQMFLTTYDASKEVFNENSGRYSNFKKLRESWL